MAPVRVLVAGVKRLCSDRWHVWAVAANEAAYDRDYRFSRLQLCWVLLQLIRRQWAARCQRGANVGPWKAPEVVNAAGPCRNNALTKAFEVREALDGCAELGTPLRAALDELYRRGAFHHGHDVAYAAIAIVREKRAVDEIIAELVNDYAEIRHRCDPVYPPS